MFKSIFILLLFSAIATSNNVTTSKDEQYKHGIIIKGNSCSNTTILQRGNVWILVKSDFNIESVNCGNGEANRDVFTWDKGSAKVSFPQHHTLLLYLEDVDRSFAGKWNCLFLGPDITKHVLCTIDFQVRGTFQTASGVLQNTRKWPSKQSTAGVADSWVWIGILIGITLILIIALTAVIIYYKRKMERYECESEEICKYKRPVERPSLTIPEEPVVEFENKPISDRISTTSDNIYEGVYNHDADLLRSPPVRPQKATRFITIKRP